ncbi:MAG: hypothetical protein SFV32_07250 [Opitutaceae bacterium]|nr:hypothetical protein [Opitutaceae bacterium]
MLTDPPLELPRISLNPLGEFPFISEAKKFQILTDQRFGNDIKAPYYQSASCAAVRALQDGHLEAAEIHAEIAKLRQIAPRSDHHAVKLENNIDMLARLLRIKGEAVPSTGDHRALRRSATMELGGVTVSVRPEFITTDARTGLFSLTKFRFSKSKVSADASEIILLVLLKYGQQLVLPGFHLDPSATRLVDAYSGNIIFAHTLPRIRESQLQSALRDICRIWPTLVGLRFSSYLIGCD